ncbi:MAG: YidC/Oxa1 family membrane protein insertase, partial [Oscillospiraceae bacterium]
MQFIIDIFAGPLGFIMYLVYETVQNYGLAIIIFTFITKALLFPLSIKQQKSSAMMSAMQPKIKEIQRKYKSDRVKMQEEMMAVYKDNNVSQMAGCLPLLIQMPILFGLINVIYNPLTHILRLPKDIIKQAIEVIHTNNLISGSSSAVESAIKVAVDRDSSIFTMFSESQIEAIQSLDTSFLGVNLGDTPTFALNNLIIIPILSVICLAFAQYITMKVSGSLDNAGAGVGAAKSMLIFSCVMSFSFSFAVPVGVSV